MTNLVQTQDILHQVDDTHPPPPLAGTEPITKGRCQKWTITLYWHMAIIN